MAAVGKKGVETKRGASFDGVQSHSAQPTNSTAGCLQMFMLKHSLKHNKTSLKLNQTSQAPFAVLIGHGSCDTGRSQQEVVKREPYLDGDEPLVAHHHALHPALTPEAVVHVAALAPLVYQVDAARVLKRGQQLQMKRGTGRGADIFRHPSRDRGTPVFSVSRDDDDDDDNDNDDGDNVNENDGDDDDNDNQRRRPCNSKRKTHLSIQTSAREAVHEALPP